MEKLEYTLPKKAQSIIEELAKNEMNQFSFKTYLSNCCLSKGYVNAAKYYLDDAREEYGHYLKWRNFLSGRNVEAEVYAIEQPVIKGENLTDFVRADYQTELDATMKYDEASRAMANIDTLTYLEVLDFMRVQKYALDKCNEKWLVVAKLKEDEDMFETDKMLFGSTPEAISC